MDKETLNILKDNSIFRGMSIEQIVNFTEKSNCKLNTYGKNDIIAVEQSNCDNIGLIIEGVIEIQNIYENGSSLTIQRFSRGDVFGEALVFSENHKYPATIISSTKSKVLFISKESIVESCFRDLNFLNNFMCLLSEKIIMLNNKIRNTSLKSIRQKVCNFILEQYKKQDNLTINLNINKKELAEMLGIPRPSLSRELIKLKNEEIIELSKGEISILNLDEIKNIMCK